MKTSKTFFIFLFLGILLGGIGIITYGYYNSIPKTVGPTEIDLTFANWEITGDGTYRYIEDKGTYIEIYDNYNGAYIQATLDVGSIISGNLSIQLKTPVSDKDGAFRFDLLSGIVSIITITRDKSSGDWYFRDIDGALTLLIAKDLIWHDIKISFELDGDDSVVSIWVDDAIEIDAFEFETDLVSIDTLQMRSGKYFIPNLTQLVLLELIKYN